MHSSECGCVCWWASVWVYEREICLLTGLVGAVCVPLLTLSLGFHRLDMSKYS